MRRKGPISKFYGVPTVACATGQCLNLKFGFRCDPAKSQQTKTVIDECWHGGGTIYLSVVSIWEIALLVDQGHVELDLPIDGDPADRGLIASAIDGGFPPVTYDDRIRRFARAHGRQYRFASVS